MTLVENLKEVGYDPKEDSGAEFWIYDRVGRLIEAELKRVPDGHDP